MLKLYIGPAGSGKTAAVMDEIRARVEAGQPGSWLLVPEQYSHEAERELCLRCGDSMSRFAEVFSFSGLSRRILAEHGGAAEPYLDKGGRLLCMALAVNGAGGRLKAYRPARRRSEFPALMLGAVDELKSAGVGVEQLQAAAVQCDRRLGDKLQDTALLLESYEAVMSNGHADPADRLSVLARTLPSCAFAPGHRVYVDGFIDFTRQEREVLDVLLRCGVELIVCLTLDELYGSDEIFALSRRAAQSLAARAAQLGVETVVRTFEEGAARAPALQRYARELFRYTELPVTDARGAIRLHRAESMAEECEFAAARALELVRGGARWRDIAVAVRGFEDYRALLESVFRHYGVPLYLTRRSEFLRKPLPALIQSAYEILENGWDVDELVSYLRTGLTGLSIDECDRLENYVFLWQLRAAAWQRRGDWRQHPDGYGRETTESSQARLAEINALRRRVAQPLQRLERRGREAHSAAGQAAALALFLEELQLPETLERRAAELLSAGQESLAAEYRQLWEIVVSALEQCEAVLGETEMDLFGFGRLFVQMLSQYDVGTIPVSLDRVSAGDFDRMRRRSIRHLIVLGASDDRLPLQQEQGGLFSGDERERLLELDIDLGAGEAELWREFALIYHTLSLPSETLDLSFSNTAADGGVQRPAFVFSRAHALFALSVEPVRSEDCRLAAPAPALTLAAAALHGGDGKARAAADYMRVHRPERFAALEAAAALKRGSLSPAAVKTLYGDKLRLSASRIDRFSACRFAYFCQYGLDARPYAPADFTPPEIGSFLHFVLEQSARAVKERGGFGCVEDGELRQLVRGFVNDYVQRELNDFQEKSARFVYLFRRLIRDAESIVLDTAQELRSSDFEPLDFELDFARAGDLPPAELGDGESSLMLTGVADRVDGWLHEGKLYLRVVDYKTGVKKFSLSDVWYGMGLQMLLYLFTLEAGGASRYGREIRAAGVMYLPARDALLSASRRPEAEEAAAQRAKKLRRSGLVLNDPELIEAWEKGEDKRYIPVTFRGGKPSAGVAAAEQLGRLSRHIQKLLRDMARQLRQGSIAADPYFRSGSENACQFCEYAEACQFSDGEGGESCRYLPALRDEKVWELIDKEVAEDG